MHITLRQLEVFAEVLKSGSTTQASQMLALSQSAVSAALTDLEGQLGVQLFDRVGKRLVVNEHGRLLYPRALALLEQAIEIEQLFREDNGAIRVFASSTIGNYILPEVIARYRRDFPTLPLEMSVGYLSIMFGALMWWFGLTWLIDKIRGKFDTNGILIINKVIGSIVIIFSLIALVGTVFNLYHLPEF